MHIQTISNPANSTVTPQAKRDCPTDNDTNEDNQAIKPCITVVEENESDVNEDTSIACPSVVSSNVTILYHCVYMYK